MCFSSSDLNQIVTWSSPSPSVYGVTCSIPGLEYIAQFQVTVLVRLGSVWFWLVTVLLLVWPQSFLLCPFHKKLRIWWKKSFGFCQTDNPRFSCIMYCYRYRQLTRKNLEVNSVPYVCRQRGSPLLSALEIFLNNSCLLELRGQWYLDTHALSLVPGPPGVESGAHSYCCDFCKLLLDTTTRL